MMTVHRNLRHHRGCTCPERRGTRIQDTAGFTLIEVIVSLAVLAVIMTPLTIVFTQTIRETRDVSARLARSSDAQRIGAAWVRDVQSLDRVGTDGNGPCAGAISGGTDLVTFYWDQAPNQEGSGQPVMTPRSATWAATGTGAGMRLVRRECEAGVMVREQFLADRIGDEGQTPLQAVHGPGGPGTRNFCTATKCTLVVSGSFDYEVTGTRRVSGAISTDQAPPPPTITGVGERNKYLSVGWTPPTLPVGTSAITGYRVEAWSTPTGGLVSYTEISASSNAADVTGLTNGVSYWVVVYARNNVGFGEPSAAWGPAVPKATEPSRPASVTVVAGPVSQPGSLDVSWDLPTDDGDRVIDGYRISVVPEGDTTPLTFDVGASPRSFRVPNLDLGRRFSVTVRAHNSIGWGADSDPVLGITRPPKPVIVSADSAPGATLVTFSISGNGGSSGSGVPLLATGAVRVTATCVTPSASCTDTTFLLDHPSPASPNGDAGPLDTSTAVPTQLLVNGQAYNIRVEVQNSSGWGQPSDPITVTPLTTPAVPAAMVSIQATGVSRQLRFDINPGTYGGGTTITHYRVAYQVGGGGERYRDIPAADPATTTFTWTFSDPTTPAGGAPLTNFTAAAFTVEACNSVGCSDPTPAYTAVPGIQPVAATPTVVRGAAVRSVVVTPQITAGTGTASTLWSVTCVGGGTLNTTGSTPVTFTNMPPGNTTCTALPTNRLQRTVNGVSGNFDLVGISSSATVEVYGAPAKPLPPTLTLPATGIVNNVTITPGADQASGGSNPAVTYVATCSGPVSSPNMTGPRVLGGFTPGSTISCTVTAYNIAGYPSPTSDPVTIKLRRFAPEVLSMEGTKTISVEPNGQDSNANKFRVMAVVKHDPGLTVTSYTYNLGGASGTVTSPTVWKTDSSDSTFTVSYVWVNIKPPNGDWAGIGSRNPRGMGKSATLTFNLTYGDAATRSYDYFAVSEFDNVSGEDLPAIFWTGASTDYVTKASGNSIDIEYKCDDNDSGTPKDCDSMKIRLRRIDVASGSTTMLSCTTGVTWHNKSDRCETNNANGGYVVGNFNADDNVQREYDYKLPTMTSGFWVIEGAPCNETGKCPDFYGTTPPTAGSLGAWSEATFYQMIGSFWVP